MRLLSAVALVVLLLVPTACGSSGGSRNSGGAGLPRALAREWARQASAIAGAVAAGEGCRASRLAVSLREEVRNAGAQVPARFRRPLAASVSSLADRLTCTPPPQKVTVTVETTPTGSPHKAPHKAPPTGSPHKAPHKAPRPGHKRDHHGHGPPKPKGHR